ncbi:MAG: HlyD family secretion protein [Flavobacteriales bacterium]
MDTLSDDTKGVKVVRILVTSLVVVFLMLLLPWTQNVVATGKIISRYPDKKPQQVNTMIDGRIVKWFAYEGQDVAKGDTILILEEVKPEYLDPQLVQRTRELIEAKINGIAAYRDKIVALQDQELALQQARDLELSQARLKVDQSVQKVQADSAMVRQEELNIQIERERLSRAEELFKDGLITTTDFESRSLKLQESDAKFIKARNDYEVSKQSYEMAVLEVRRKAADFADKLAKNRSDQATTQAMLQDGIAERTKLENSLVNYINRETGRMVLAPQEGRIVAAVSSGMGEIVKAGTSVVTIQPLEFIEAAELYVEAMDVPILHPGAKARLQLDGWPALVFSGWPSASIGTFGAEVVSVDQVINQKGKYRVILAPDPDEGPWPRPISIGSGALGILLLKDVPLGYELWRQLNGFPPEFYTEEDLYKDSGEEKK